MQRTPTPTLLSSKEAQVLLATLTGKAFKSYEFYNKIRSGTLRVALREEGHMLFQRDEVERAAHLLKPRVQEAGQKEDLFTTRQALAYLQERGHTLKRGTFHKRIHALLEAGEIPAPRMTEHPRRPQYLFQRGTLEMLKKVLDNEVAQMQQFAAQGWMTPRQISEYLSGKYQRIISLDLVYSKINRGVLVPIHTEHDGKNRAYFFEKEAVDKLNIGPSRNPNKPPVEVPEIVAIKHLNQVAELEKRVGSKLLTKHGVLEVYQKRTGKKYTEETLKQQRKRGTLLPVASIGGAYLYRAKDAESVHLAPLTGRRMPSPEDDAPSPGA